MRRLLDGHEEGQPLQLSQLRAALGNAKARLAFLALEEFGLVVDDTVPTMRRWIDRQVDALPAGYREEAAAALPHLPPTPACPSGRER
ncbi:hypothetical protein ACFYYP_32920 [Microbispora rosea]|uniref:hypothetical protein n=1 Tax=Microbispora rosea TaxID=58117 RepID=UPI0036B2F948